MPKMSKMPKMPKMPSLGEHMKEVLLGFLILGVIALIIFLPAHQLNSKALLFLLTNKTNLILLFGILLLIALVNWKVALVSAIVLLFLVIAVNRKNNTHVLSNTLVDLLHDGNVKVEHQNNKVDDVVELKAKPSHVETTPLTANDEEVILNKKLNSILNVPNSCLTNANYLTQDLGKDYHGYDVAGCRYDLTHSPQNNTMNGPPVSLDSAYNKAQLTKCGTFFYPLHG